VTFEISRKAGLIRKKLLERDRKIKTPDAIIAATSVVNHLQLVTRDSDFRGLTDFGLKQIDLD
jgi:predicted nucleic acid-binding protein